MNDKKNSTRILLCEDDENLGLLLCEYLEAKGYEVVLKKDGAAGYQTFSEQYFDICVLDVMMPIKDGFTMAKEIRTTNTTVPIIFLTAKTLKEDILEGFHIGADDYITKPFSMEELLLRIEAVLRRAGAKRPTEDATYKFGKFIFDTNKQILTINGVEDKLTTKESDLLALLCANSNEILERNMALKTIWEEDSYFNARSMDVYITKLRKRLKDDPEVEIINVHGKGYKLVYPQND